MTVKLKMDDLLRLYNPTKHINDSIVSRYLQMLTRVLRSGGNRVNYCEPLFTETIDRNRTRLPKINSWKIIIWPQCVSHHWIVFIINTDDKKATLLDSYPFGRDYTKDIRQYVGPEYTFHTMDCPRQNDLDSCGAHLLNNVKNVLFNKDPNHNKTAEKIRDELCEDLLNKSVKFHDAF